MNKYVSIEYSGPYSSLIKFIESKDLKFDVKPVQTGKAFLKISDELLDDVFFLSDAVIDEAKNEKITIIKEISESEFNNTSENGFEIIHNDDHSHNHSTTLTNDTKVSNAEEHKTNQNSTTLTDTAKTVEANSSVVEEINKSVKSNITTNDTNTISFPAPTVPINFSTEKVVVQTFKTDEDKLKAVSIGLSDTILPSKSPLPENDPFKYLTSCQYLSYFAGAATITIFVLALLD